MKLTLGQATEIKQRFEDARQHVTRAEDRVRNRIQHGESVASVQEVIVEEAARVMFELSQVPQIAARGKR